MIDNEEEYQEWLKKGKELLEMCRSFPAHELSSFHNKHHKDDGDNVPLLVWSVHLEAE